MNRPLSIAIVHNNPPGGGLRFIEATARALGEDQTVTVWSWGPEPDPPVDGVEQRWLPAPRIALPPPLHPFTDLVRSVVGSIRVARAIDVSGHDAAVVYACRWGQAPIGLRKLRTPAIYFAHEARRRSTEPGYRPSGVERSGWRRAAWALGRRLYDGVAGALDRHAMHSSTTFATSSRWMVEELRATYRIEPIVVEPGVDTDRFRLAPGEPTRKDVLFVGALDPTKRADLAVRALACLPADRRPALRVVYNRRSRDFVARLDRLASELDVALVHRRAISDDELVAEYQHAAVLVACADREPFGLTIPEASACGTPTVAVDAGGYRETVTNGRNGLLVAATPDSIAHGIAAALEPGAFDHVAIADDARHRWSWERCAQEIRSLCASVASSEPAPVEKRVVELGQRGPRASQ